MINESALLQNHYQDFDSIFEKLNTYSVYRSEHEELFESSENDSYDILFNLNEQESISVMFSMLEEGILDKYKLKNFAHTIKNKAHDATKVALERYRELKKFFIDLKNEAITKASQLIKKFLELISKLGDKISDIMRKIVGADAEQGESLLAGYVKDRVETHALEDVNIFESLYYATMDSSSLNMLNEDEETLKGKFQHSKTLQRIFGYRYPGGLSVWKTILWSTLGSIVVTLIIPALVSILGAGATTVAGITLACKILWVGRGVTKVLLNRWVNKNDADKFFNFKTCLQLFLVVGIPALFQVPAIKEGFVTALKRVGEALHLDQLIDKAEDWFNGVVAKFTGKDIAHYTVTERIEESEKVVNMITGNPKGEGGIETMFMDRATVKSGKVHDWISNAIDSLKNKFSVVSDEQLSETKSWLDKIADATFKSSKAMHDGITGTYPGDNLVVAIDSNRLNSLFTQGDFVNKVSEIAASKGITGEAMTTVNTALHQLTDAAAGSVHTVAFDCLATQENIDIVKDIFQEAVEQAGQAGNISSTFFTVCNENIVSGTATEVVTQTVTDTVVSHVWFDNIAEMFEPLYMPVFNIKGGMYAVRLGSNTTGYKAYPVVDEQKVDLKQLINGRGSVAGLNEMVRMENDIRRQQAEDLQKQIDKVKKDGGDTEKLEKKKKALAKKIKDFNADVPSKHKVIVLYVDYNGKKRDGTIVNYAHEPWFYINPNTLMAADIAIHYPKRRANAYPLKGLFSRVEFVPLKMDSGMLASKWNETLLTFIKIATNDRMSEFATKKYDKWVPKDPDNKNKKLLTFGNFTAQELCDILNEDEKPIKYLSGEYADDSHIKGGLKHDYIEQQGGEAELNAYRDKLIVPWIKDKEEDLYKYIKGNKQFSKYLLDENGDVSDEAVQVLAPYLLRPNSVDIDHENSIFIKKIGLIFKKKNPEYKVDIQLVKQFVTDLWKIYHNTITKKGGLARLKKKYNYTYGKQSNESYIITGHMIMESLRSVNKIFRLIERGEY